MTVGIIYRVPGHGAVIGCDSRLTDESGAISSDHWEKWGIFGSVIACYAGTIGGLWQDLRDKPTKNWPEFRKAITDLDATQAHDRDYEVLVYDRRKDIIWHTGHQGDAVRHGGYAAIGAGGGIALGALDVSSPAKSLDSAERLVRRAVKISCRRHSSCGGRIKTVVVPRKDGKIVIL